MKKYFFNDPLRFNESYKSTKNFLDIKAPLHGPGKYTQDIKKILIKKFGFTNIYLTNSCTSAMEMAALALNLKSTDEVIIPSYTFTTTGSSFARTGCKIKYCDISEKNLMPTYSQILDAVNKKTKAIVIVHYQGFSVDYLDKLKFFCKKKKNFVNRRCRSSIWLFFKKETPRFLWRLWLFFFSSYKKCSCRYRWYDGFK